MRLREVYKPKGVRYTIYRGEKPQPFHDSGIPLGSDIPRKAFMRGVPSKLINHIMNKLETEVPSEKFYTELEEGLPAKIATAAGISLAGDIVAKGVKKIAKKVKNDPKDDEDLDEKAPSDAIYGIFANGKDITARYSSLADAKKAAAELQQKNSKTVYTVKKADPENIEEAPMGPIAKAAATAGAVAGLAGGVAADPGAIPGTEPQANPEYNQPGDNTPVPKVNLKQYEKPIKQLAVNFMKQQEYFSGMWPKGTTGPYITGSNGKVYMATREIGKNYIVLNTRYREASLGAAPPNAMNTAEITIRFGGYSPTTITSVELDVLNDNGPDLPRYVYKKFTGKVPHLSDQKFTKPGQMTAAGFYELIGKDISKIK